MDVLCCSAFVVCLLVVVLCVFVSSTVRFLGGCSCMLVANICRHSLCHYSYFESHSASVHFVSFCGCQCVFTHVASLPSAALSLVFVSLWSIFCPIVI